MTETVKLTQYSKGGGCGCKIAPAVLQRILKTETTGSYQNLLVGNESSDDAAVYQVSDDLAIISTSDFFLPIVDDPIDFGKIAAANAISDVYAMGGTPLMAIAILGWPVEKIAADVAQQVLAGARAVCRQAGIPLAGGHTIDCSDPVFGLAVTGSVPLKNLKKNNTAREGDVLFLTKPIGVGILATALKRGVLQPDDYTAFIEQMTSLNKIGEELGRMPGVHAMTDVTGFGLLGHLMEMAEGSALTAELFYSSVQKMPSLPKYLQQRTIPDATFRNWNSYSSKVEFAKAAPGEEAVNVMEAFNVLPDPQTNGGLLISVAEDTVDKVKRLFAKHQLNASESIGRFVSRQEKVVAVK